MHKTTFMDLIRESVIFQGLLALIVITGLIAMLLMRIPVNEEMWVVVGTVLGYFFGAKGFQNLRAATSESTQLLAQIAQQNAQVLESLTLNGRVIAKDEG